MTNDPTLACEYGVLELVRTAKCEMSDGRTLTWLESRGWMLLVRKANGNGFIHRDWKRSTRQGRCLQTDSGVVCWRGRLERPLRPRAISEDMPPS